MLRRLAVRRPLGPPGRRQRSVGPILLGSTRRRWKERTSMAIEIDPVCGMEVDTTTSDLSYEYQGKTYWFCGRGCLLEFKDDPEKYLDPEHRPSM
jgi:YHS domain-containing protein